VSTIVKTSRGPGCLLQLLWFVLVGWWAGQAAIAIAYVCFVTVIGIPIGIAILNNLPLIIALRPASETLVIGQVPGGQAVVTTQPQLPLLVRAIWFILAGWWLTALWLEAAYFLCAIVIGLPLGFWMFDRTAAVLTLRQG
jgi:uncharacterized membrane protein YccF (DUF307 family)